MTKHIVYSLLSESSYNRLEFLGRIVGDAQWEIGECAVQACISLDMAKAQTANNPSGLTPAMIDEIMSTGYMDVYAAIGEITGVSRRSISDYKAVVNFYTPEVHAEFDVLPFAHFLFALRFGEQWLAILELSRHQMDFNNGRPPSVEWLEVSFRGVGSIEPVRDEMDVSDISYDCLAYPESPLPEGIPSGTRWALDRIRQAIQSIGKLAENLDLPTSTSRRLLQAIETFMETIHAIYAEMPENTSDRTHRREKGSAIHKTHHPENRTSL